MSQQKLPRSKAKTVNPKDLLGILKPNLFTVPPSSTIHEAMAMGDGARKYGPFNWRSKKVVASIYIAAAQRHLLAYLDREDIDPKSKVHHLGHAKACCGILLDATETGNLIDDRPQKGPAADLIRRLTLEPKGRKL